jgi:hypothetical protein
MNETFIDNNETTFKYKTLLTDESHEEIDDNINEILFEKIKNNDSDIDNDNYENFIKKQYKCFFTNILNIQKENKIIKEYNSWLNKNYNELQSAFYIISKNYFDYIKLNREITFKEFTEFCFFSN